LVGVRSAIAMSLVIRSPAIGITAVWRIDPSVKIATSVVPATMCTLTSSRPPLMPIGSLTSWPSITNSCACTSSRRWSFGMLIAFAVSTTRATSTGVTSLSRTITMPVEFWPRM
jgi:hypothetical protein